MGAQPSATAPFRQRNAMLTAGKRPMNSENAKITVYYDGACPKCLQDRESHEKMAGEVY